MWCLIVSISDLCIFLTLDEECPKLLCGMGIDHRRKTIPPWNSTESSSGHQCMSGIYNMALEDGARRCRTLISKGDFG